MRIIRYKGSDGNIKEEFADSFGVPLNQAKKSHLGISHLEIVHKIFDSHDNFLGFKMREYDKLGAISPKGEIYADFLYNRFEGVTRLGYGSIGDDNKQELWMGKKDGDLYDIYHRYDLIFEDAISRSHLVLDDFTRDDRNYQYAQIVTEDGYKVYDIFNKSFLNFTADDSISYIHSKYKKVLLARSRSVSFRVFEYTNTLIDFDGNILGKYVGPYFLRFTENEEFFEIYNDGKSGLLKLINGEFEEVIPAKYRKIVQVFKDKAVVLNSQNCVKIVHFEKKVKKGIDIWANKLDSYKLPKEVVAGFFLEDESEGILTLSNGMKILFSLYMQGNDEKFQCEEIIYEGNSVFKCYQFKGADTATITFICNGQAVNAVSKDNDGHIVKVEENGTEKFMLFTPDGKRMGMNLPDSMHSSANKMNTDKYFYDNTTVDFMTVRKDEWHNLVRIYCHGGINTENYLFNLLKGTTHKYHYCQQMVWHNIYMDGSHYDLHTVRGSEDYLKPLKNFVAGFNDYAVFDSWQGIYLINRNHNITEFKKAQVKVDEFYQMCVITTEDKAIVVSNDGVEEFKNTGRVVLLPAGMKPVYQSATSGNYVVGCIFVDANLLKYEAMTDTIDKRLATL